MAGKHSFVAGMAAQYSGWLRRFLRLNLANASDVPDLAQEVFVLFLRVRNHEDIRSPDSASPILFLRSQPDLLVTETDTELRVSRRGNPP
jgi:DNA-directed RNA polymerase specialized sigma24 family protein